MIAKMFPYSQLSFVKIFVILMAISCSARASDTRSGRELSEFEKDLLSSLTIELSTNSDVIFTLKMPYRKMLAMDNITTEVAIPKNSFSLTADYHSSTGDENDAIEVKFSKGILNVKHTTIRSTTISRKKIETVRTYTIEIPDVTFSQAPYGKLFGMPTMITYPL